MPAGAPVTNPYKPEYKDAILDLMRQGYSLTAAASQIGVYRQRVYEWAKIDDELSDAIKLGQGLRTYKLETDLLASPDSPTVTSRIFALKNSAPDEWREKQEHEHSGHVGVGIVERVIVDKETPPINTDS